MVENAGGQNEDFRQAFRDINRLYVNQRYGRRFLASQSSLVKPVVVVEVSERDEARLAERAEIDRFLYEGTAEQWAAAIVAFCKVA